MKPFGYKYMRNRLVTQNIFQIKNIDIRNQRNQRNHKNQRLKSAVHFSDGFFFPSLSFSTNFTNLSFFVFSCLAESIHITYSFLLL